MRIDQSRSVTRTGTSSVRSSTAGPGFADLVGQPKAANVSGSLPLSPLASIIGLSADEPEQDGRKRAVRYANNLLDELEGLHRAVCLGSLDLNRLKSLSAKLRNMPPQADPELTDLIGQMEVRIAVELARYGL